MKSKFIGQLTIATAISALVTPIGLGTIYEFPAQAKTQIRDLQRSRGTTLSGKVISVVGNNFILDDGTGQIIVDAGPRWWQEINVSLGEQLTVVGESDRTEFDAFSIIRSDGSVINIRPTEGPPPWAGGRNRNYR
jgi:hypothetical protein